MMDFLDPIEPEQGYQHLCSYHKTRMRFVPCQNGCNEGVFQAVAIDDDLCDEEDTPCPECRGAGGSFECSDCIAEDLEL